MTHLLLPNWHPPMLDASIPALQIYRGQTQHARYRPFVQSFSYKLFLIDIDIDRIEEASLQSVLFSAKRFGLFSFKQRDHGYRKNEPLRPWAEAMFGGAGVDLQGGPIRLITLPRHLFYKFAPISLWFGYDKGGLLRGVIYEVNNTFGDTHAYVARVSDGRNQHEADKQLYVSPFFDVSGKYRFTVRSPNERLSLIIENIENGKHTHMANIIAKREPATSMSFLRAAVTRPFSTLGVSLAIHFEALKLWFRKAGYRPRPPAPEQPMTPAQPLAMPLVKTESKIEL